MSKIGLILMASGSGVRFGANKLLCSVEGVPLYRRALQVYSPTLFHRAVVVSRYPQVLEQAQTLGFTALPNPLADEGISASIRLGLAALGDCDGALFAVCDQPWLTAESVARVLTAFASSPQFIVALSWQGERGNPCLFPASLFPALLALQGDSGGGAVIRANSHLLRLVEAHTCRELMDVDTPSDAAVL